MRVEVLLCAALLLSGCELLQQLAQEPASQQPATVVAEVRPPSPDVPAETPIPGCTVDMAPRWSVAPAGMPSFIANFEAKQNETRSVPLVVERSTANQVAFSFVTNPAASANTAAFTGTITKLKSGVCGMTGTFQPFPGSFENSVTMVPLTGTRLVQ